MLEKIEELLVASDVVDKVVGQVLFSQEGMAPVGDASSPLKKE
ncbi:hypothetical protein DFAR_1700006 [Desulfarculales bacterium]